MMMLIFVSAVLVSLAFDRQERRHRMELELECSRYGVDPPRQRPRIGRFEGFLNIGAGSLLLIAGGAIVWVLFQAPTKSTVAGGLQLGGLFIAAGLALVLLGARALSRAQR
jgi:hypothetical protein